MNIKGKRLACLYIVCGLSLASLLRVDARSPTNDIYLFTFFRGDSKDGLHLAFSADGLKWEPLKQDRSFLTPAVGEEKLMRDPTLCRGPDGIFHLVWTTAWRGQTIGYASSKDLINWSEQRAIPVMANEPDCQQCWAPEVRYDASKEEFVIYWSSTVGRGDGTRFRTYAATTKDWKTFTPAKVFFDPGFAQIDASVLDGGEGKFLLFFKHNGQGIQIAAGEKLQGPFTDTGTQFAHEGGDQWEGAWPTKIGNEYVVYVDHYKNRNRMGAWRSRDLKSWEDITSQTSGLFDMRHGSVVKVPKTVVDALATARDSAKPQAAGN